MDVLIVTPWFPNHRTGWPAQYISVSALALVKAGGTVRVVVTRGWRPPWFERFVPVEHCGEIQVESFPELESVCTFRYVAMPKCMLRRVSNASLEGTVRRSVNREIAIRRPDALHVHTEALAPAAVATACRDIDCRALSSAMVAIRIHNTSSHCAKFIARHPPSSKQPLTAFWRYGRCQIESRLRREVEFNWIGGSKLVARNGMTGATGNIYCGLHEFADMGFLLHLLRPGDLFLDAAANIGSYTVLSSAVCGARTIAVEPDPDTIRLLRLHATTT